MLQQLSYQEGPPPAEQSAGHFFTPEYFYDIVKRRWFYFLIPFVLIFGVGAAITMLLPATYVSTAKMLIESQEIPTDLVQPTVSTVADERVALLQQRILVRDRLLAIAEKYKLAELARRDRFLGRWRPALSATDIVDLMRERTQIIPLKSELPGRPNQRQFIAFTVSFEHERPEVARLVANELVTTILDEDVRARTNSALETTRFLEREHQRLESALDSLELKLAEAKKRETQAPAGPASAAESQLAALKTELLIKSATYSDTHPDMKALKEKIAALEKLTGAKTNKNDANDASVTAEVSVDTLERQRASTKKDLDGITQKLAAARLGESLERGQHSERLSVIEQPTLPQEPVRPDRPKLLGKVFALAIAASGGLVFAFEMLDGTLRSNADIAKLVDSHLIVSIPYISTKAELARKKSRKIMLVILFAAFFLLGCLGSVIYLSRKFGLF
jgi:uncharacterized protein involved in exopolysaccharide biosynthesis